MAKGRALVSFKEMDRKVCNSSAELDFALRKMMNFVPEMVDDLLRDVLESLYLELAGEGEITTPIDTGRARSGWVAGVKETEWCPPNMKNNPKSAQEILAAVRMAINALPPSEVYFLCNNVPYILQLERGHSDQAPNGFIAVALANIAAELRQKAQELSDERD